MNLPDIENAIIHYKLVIKNKIEDEIRACYAPDKWRWNGECNNGDSIELDGVEYTLIVKEIENQHSFSYDVSLEPPFGVGRQSYEIRIYVKNNVIQCRVKWS